jgi:hypothetical protein
VSQPVYADVKNVVMGGWKRRRFDKSLLLGGIGRLMEGILPLHPTTSLPRGHFETKLKELNSHTSFYSKTYPCLLLGGIGRLMEGILGKTGWDTGTFSNRTRYENSIASEPVASDTPVVSHHHHYAAETFSAHPVVPAKVQSSLLSVGISGPAFRQTEERTELWQAQRGGQRRFPRRNGGGVGMRVRKSVAEGYRTQMSKTEEKVPLPTAVAQTPRAQPYCLGHLCSIPLCDRFPDPHSDRQKRGLNFGRHNGVSHHHHYAAETFSAHPVVPAKVQSSLLSVGMRVRKKTAIARRVGCHGRVEREESEQQL